MKALKIFGLFGMALAMASCSGSGNKEQADSVAAETDTFAEEQPVECGVYDATYFEIKGKDARKGQFDGRVIYSLSPEQSAFFVFENGNRTKIKHLVMLETAFAKGDSTYTATDKQGVPVVLSSDSVNHFVNYVLNGDTVTITFNQKARNAYTAIEAMQRIVEERSK